MSCICHWSCMTADPISAVQWRERQIIQTATKDMLTLNSVDETGKTDNTSGRLAHDEALQPSSGHWLWCDYDGVMKNMAIVLSSCHLTHRLHTNQYMTLYI